MSKEYLKDIVQDLINIRSELSLKNDDNNIFDCAVRIYNAEKIKGEKNYSKNSKKRPIDKSKIDPSAPATEKQSNMLKQLGHDVPADLTKLEAMGMIDAALEEKKNKKNKEPEDVGSNTNTGIEDDGTI